MALTQVSTKGIEDGTILNEDINASAAIAGSKLANASINANDKLENSSITENKLGSGIVSTAKIADSAITLSKIANAAVTTAKIQNLTILNNDINASAAIEGTKISPDFGSQNVTTTGNLGGKNLNLLHTAPTISLTDTNADDDFQIKVDGGLFKIIDATNTVDRLVIDSSGNVGIGYSSPTGKLDVGGTINVGNTGSNTSATYNLIQGYGYRIGAALYGRVGIRSTYTSNTNAGTLDFYTGSGGQNTAERMRIDSFGIVRIGDTTAGYENNDSLLNIIKAASGGTENPLITLWNPTTASDARAGLDFLTNAQSGTGRDGAFIRGSNDGSTAQAHIQFGTISNETYTEKIRFQTGGGISFNGDTAAANALDDFETGTWTPVLKSGTNTISYSGGTPSFRYTKIGNMVYVNFTSGGFTTSGTTGGDFSIEGLPFTSVDHSRHIGSIINNWSVGLQLSTNFVYIHLNKNQTTIHPYKKDPVNAGGQYGHPQVTNVGTSTHMQWSLVYQAA